MVNYILAATARNQATAMLAELETHAPGAAQRLARSAFTELQTWPELTVDLVPEARTGSRCSVAGAYDFGPPARISVADAASRARRDFTAMHELGHHLQKNSFDLMAAFESQSDGGLLLEDAACDTFAAEILLPTPLVDHHLDAAGPTAPDIVELWRASGASRMAVCVRAVQHLPAPGHILLLDTGGQVVFAASHGLPPLRRGSFQGDIPTIAQARAGQGRADGRTQVRYRDGILGRELHAQTAPMNGYLVAVLVTDSAPWRTFTPPTKDTGPQAGEYICEHCDEEYRSFDPACPVCRVPNCPECGRCSCPARVSEHLCQGCFTLHPPAMFADGADRCLDCS
ncbi:ImmA/IrrE family metallo-endopeptidase [Streptomyces sp. NBC_01210]|uniref:ImmA/IrrE family metallo-endopeptidase n=1 Tax=Streptomyces sp. NBC_01210 TaxID=2903774 RepID=UPI002E163EB5|nr:ImmA/IrrE family metallo-endopeptidase [Streptomyces sp. NBC_01210]WSR03796.1 ImmA/IrrE family metallo-endopeptidase [Streptomyces sp. NBC_01210]